MNKTMPRFLWCAFTAILINSCQYEPQSLPILGERDFVDGDTIYHTIPDFAFINQDSQLVTNASYEGKAYVADFFFISCPTICPKLTRSMLLIYDHFENEDRLGLLAHSIDPKRDTVGALSSYAYNLGVSAPKWNFVTGDKDVIYKIANDYFSIAIEDPEAPGGFDHSGRLILVDKNRHIRSYCDGTDDKDVARFVKDIEKLLNEK